MRHVFIINPRSLPEGKERDTLLDRIREKCRGLEYDIYFSTSGEDAAKYAQASCRDGAPTCVYAGGGDGTVRRIADAIHTFKNAVLSAIPTGTGNDFVRNFGGQKRFMELEHITDGEEIEIDLMQANDMVCANIINIGFDESVVSRVDSLQSFRLLKAFSYTLGVVLQLLKFPKECLQISGPDGVIYDNECLLAYFANGKYYGGGFKSASRASLTDGLIDNMIVRSVSRLKFISLVGKYKKGTLLDSPKALTVSQYGTAPEYHIRKSTPFRACLDGEVFSFTDLTIKILPKAIRFRFPKGGYEDAINSTTNQIDRTQHAVHECR